MFQDRFAVAQFSKLVQEYKIQTVVETGTYRGDSTIHFLDFVDNVVTVDVLPICVGWAAGRLFERGFTLSGDPGKFMRMRKDQKCVSLYQGNSPEIIRGVIERLPEPLLFFLDAHWFAYWPVKDEIRAIQPRPNSLIIVHDIYVPGKDYGSDSYNGKPLDIDLIREDLNYVNNNYIIFYNKEAAGDYRGILYAVPSRGEK